MFFDELDSFDDQTAAVERDGTTLSYRDLNRESDLLAENLRDDEKKLIFVAAQNDLGSLIGYLAALKSGHAAFLVNPALEPGLLARLIEAYRPDFLWQKTGQGKVGNWWKDYQLLELEPNHNRTIHPQLRLLLSTSGSTGSPRLVRLTAANLDANAGAIAEYLALARSERPITTLPMSYSYGLSVVNSHLRVGATLLLTDDSLMTRSFWTMFDKERATSMAGVPYTYQMLKRLDLFNMELPSLRTLTQAGGRLVPELVSEFAANSRQRNIRFFVMYGQTEATARIAYLPFDKTMEKPKSIGIPIPGGNLRIVDQDGREITEAYREGELVYRGENVMMGYAESAADLSRGDELHGELKTGDIGHFDEDHFFAITGRNSRFLKVFGNRINLDEVEQFLNHHGMECACGGKDDLLCVATILPDRTEEIRNLIIKTFNIHHGAIQVSTVPHITKNAAGKVLYSDIFRVSEQ